MQCQKCCISCKENQKTCDAKKERHRAARRLIYHTKKLSKSSGGDGRV